MSPEMIASRVSLTLELVHSGAFRAARLAWEPLSAWNNVEQRALVADYHLDLCAAAMRALRVAIENYGVAVRLERHSVDVRREEMLAAAELVRKRLDALEAEFA